MTISRSADHSRPRTARVLAIGVAVVLVGLMYVLTSAGGSRTPSAQSPLIGNLAPDATGEFSDGRTFELSRRKGSWVVLNFFTHNCVPCVREHPELVRFAEQQAALGLDGAELYTIVRDSSREEVEAFFAERGGDWPVVYDPQFSFSNGFGVAQVPETWIIDPRGVVRQRLIGQVTADGLSRLLEQLHQATP